MIRHLILLSLLAALAAGAACDAPKPSEPADTVIVWREDPFGIIGIAPMDRFSRETAMPDGASFEWTLRAAGNIRATVVSASPEIVIRFRRVP